MLAGGGYNTQGWVDVRDVWRGGGADDSQLWLRRGTLGAEPQKAVGVHPSEGVQ